MRYLANDGTIFNTAEECLAHEAEHSIICFNKNGTILNDLSDDALMAISVINIDRSLLINELEDNDTSTNGISYEDEIDGIYIWNDDYLEWDFISEDMIDTYLKILNSYMKERANEN